MKISIVFVSVALVSCSIFPKIQSTDFVSYDSSTPPQYTNKNSGYIMFNPTNHYMIITSNNYSKYLINIDHYNDQIKSLKGVDLKKSNGVSDYTDSYGNKLWKISEEYLYYLILLNEWMKSGI